MKQFEKAYELAEVLDDAQLLQLIENYVASFGYLDEMPELDRKVVEIFMDELDIRYFVRTGHKQMSVASSKINLSNKGQ